MSSEEAFHVFCCLVYSRLREPPLVSDAERDPEDKIVAALLDLYCLGEDWEHAAREAMRAHEGLLFQRVRGRLKALDSAALKRRRQAVLDRLGAEAQLTTFVDGGAYEVAYYLSLNGFAIFQSPPPG